MNQTLLFLKAKAILIESIILGQCLLTFDLLLDTCKKLLSRKKIKIKLFIFLDHFFEQRSNPKASLQLRKWSKTRIVWLDSTRLGKYSKYLCKKLVFDSRYIRPLFDLLFDPEYWLNIKYFSNSEVGSSYSLKFALK